MTRSPHSVVIVGAGQSGLAAARAVRDAGLTPLILEAGDRPAGSWPGYYNSLTLFSPAGFSAMPGLDFPGDPDHYPHRDEVADYLHRYATGLGVEIRTGTRVQAVEREGRAFVVRTADGQEVRAGGVVAASGSFSRPARPTWPGQESFAGQVLHVADYRDPKDLAGLRVVVVGGGNSAVQVAYELSEVARVSIASRRPLAFLPQRRDGHDVHHWLTSSGFDDLPPEWLIHSVQQTLVMDTGDYRAALESGRLERREVFTGFDGDAVVWPGGEREPVDVVLLATGYLPSLEYLRPLGALTPEGLPLHKGGVSIMLPGLVYLGLEFQRSFASNTLRGVSRDADYVIGPLAAHVRDAPVQVGL
ncbi:NAD(P)/FAD-dependent oxidoreductase [Nonomuraea sp. NN258]|uniref:flavin-containing monooxygenase n=1 Tax=Nonomuraea antri TaxID=2730852 RepID=UPI0015691229|nr:NAD(P)/FAD-dependent oxidoreductase [Nonomuraea antri]NRQ38092.1 NAD(P)/FAD-dependent oxidoreductase [Nonomuraea antri]